MPSTFSMRRSVSTTSKRCSSSSLSAFAPLWVPDDLVAFLLHDMLEVPERHPFVVDDQKFCDVRHTYTPINLSKLISTTKVTEDHEVDKCEG